MKKTYLLVLLCVASFGVFAQNGINFDANIDVDFSEDAVKSVQVPASPVQTQVLFSGVVDSVTAINNYGEFIGKFPARESHDFIGITPMSDHYLISVNHETRNRSTEFGDGGSMTTFKAVRDANGQLEVVESELPDGRTGMYHNVDFARTVGETWTNCGGIIAPDGRIFTAEEYPLVTSWGQGNQHVMGYLKDTGDVIIGEGVMLPFNENNALESYQGEHLKRFESQGWMVEIDPATSKAIRKQYNWGRMSFEAGAITEDMSTVYLAEDERPGLFTKFVADEAGDFTSGKLYVYAQQGGDAGNWLEVPQDLPTMVNLKDWAWANGATYFIRLEWVTIIDGKVYIAETGYDNVNKKTTWTNAIATSPIGVDAVAYHHQNRAEAQGTQFTVNDDTHYYDYYGRVLCYDPAVDSVYSFLEGGPEFDSEESQTAAEYPDIHLSNPDGLGKVTINDQDYMILCEDLNGASYNRLPSDAAAWICEMYLLDMSIENPTLANLIKIYASPNGAELTGGNGTQDGKTILVDIQHPSSDNAAPYNYAATVALNNWESLDVVAKAHIPTNWADGSSAQVTSTIISEQILFSETVDSVTYLDYYRQPAGLTPARGSHDFIGITQLADDKFTLSINHETRSLNEKLGDGGGMTTFTIERNETGDFDILETELADGRVGKFHSVDFMNTVGNTWTNCGGIIAPDGRIWTAEEYPLIESWGQGNQHITGYIADTGDVVIGEGIMMPFIGGDAIDEFKGETLKKYENQGWMVEIDPATGKAIRKMYNWGRMSFEAGAIADDNKTVYLAEDERPGIFVKFVADVAGDFTSGTLYVYKEDGGDQGNWIEVPQDLETLTNMKDWAWENQATFFIRLEWVTIIDGKVYIAETGYDNVNKKSSWTGAIDIAGTVDVVADHHQARAAAQGTQFTVNDDTHYYDYYGRVLVYDPATDEVEIYLEGGPAYDTEESQTMAEYPEKHLSNPDGLGKITVNNQDYMIICEDLNGATFNRLPSDAAGWVCEMYLLDMSIENPTVADLTRIMAGPNGAELTGGNGTPDGKSILVNIQHPSSTNDAPYNYATTVELSGWDYVGIEEFFNNDAFGFQVIPNPATRYIKFNETIDVAIYNVNGSLISVHRNTNTVNVSNLTSGIYFVRNAKGETVKLIIE